MAVGLSRKKTTIQTEICNRDLSRCFEERIYKNMIKKKPKKMISSRIDEELWEQVQHFSEETGITMTKIIEKSLRDYLKKMEKLLEDD